MPRNERDDDEDRPKRRPRDEDEDHGPKQRRREDDDEADRPKRRKRDEDDDLDDYDDAPPARREKPRKSKKGDGLATVVPYRNKPALASYYCGVFAFIPVLCFLLGPIAIVLGIAGLFNKKSNPRVKGTAHAIVGILAGYVAPLAWIAAWYLIFDKATTPKN